MMEIWGTLEQLTAETICAPFLIIAECSALVPTMNPVTLCRKSIGKFLRQSQLRTSLHQSRGLEARLRLIAEPDELGAFGSLVSIDDRNPVGYDADIMAHYLRISSDEIRAKARLEHGYS